MYAHVVSELAPPSGLAALRCEPGFCGALSLSHPSTGGALLVVFWETEQQARASAEGGDVWEVVARA